MQHCRPEASDRYNKDYICKNAFGGVNAYKRAVDMGTYAVIGIALMPLIVLMFVLGGMKDPDVIRLVETQAIDELNTDIIRLRAELAASPMSAKHSAKLNKELRETLRELQEFKSLRSARIRREREENGEDNKV